MIALQDSIFQQSSFTKHDLHTWLALSVQEHYRLHMVSQAWGSCCVVHRDAECVQVFISNKSIANDDCACTRHVLNGPTSLGVVTVVIVFSTLNNPPVDALVGHVERTSELASRKMDVLLRS